MHYCYHGNMRRTQSLLWAFISGVASAGTLFPVRNNASRRFYRRAESAEDALRGDWEAVGSALRVAIDRKRAEQESESLSLASR